MKIIELEKLRPVLTSQQYRWLNQVRGAILAAVHPAGLHEKVAEVSQLLGWVVLQLRDAGCNYKQLADALQVTRERARVICQNEYGRRVNIEVQQSVGIYEKRPWEV